MPSYLNDPTYWQLVERIENDAAIISDALNQVTQFELLFRAMRRRGLIDDEDYAKTTEALARIRQALRLEQQYAFAARVAGGNDHEG